jgi:choline kinase
VEYDENGTLTRCSTNKAEISTKGELVGIHKLSSSFYHRICAEYEKIVADKPKLGYEYQLLWMSQNVSSVYVHNSSDVKWYEIDDEDDLKYAEINVINEI